MTQDTQTIPSVKLTIEIRKKILREIEKNAYEKIEEDFKKEGTVLAHKIYDALVPEKTRKQLAEIDQRYIAHTQRIQDIIYTKDQAGVLYPWCTTFCDFLKLSGAVPKVLDTSSWSENSKYLLEETNSLYKELVDFLTKVDDHLTDKKEKIKHASSILSCVNTSKQLKESWEEISSIVDSVCAWYIPASVGTAKRSSTEITALKELNSALNLPPEKTE